MTADGSTVTPFNLAFPHDADLNFRTVQIKNFSPAITHGQVVTVSYTDLTTGNDADAVIQDPSGNDVASFTTGSGGVPAVVNNVPNAAPAFLSESTTREVAENSLAGTNVGDPVTATDADNDTLTYSLEGTDAASFDIVSTSGQIRTKAGVTYDFETTSSYSVTVKADDSNGGTDTIAVAINLLDVDEAPDGTPATAPTIDTVSVTSDPGADETYAIGDTIEVTVTFDQEVKVTGRPRITLRVGGDGPEHMKSATYADAFSVALLALRFTYGVADGDGDDDGIDLEADKLELAVGGTIQGASGGVDAILAYPAPGTQGGHKVDGRRPTPTGAVIPASGDTITLTFSETVSSTTAAPGAFAVTVGPGAPSVSSVAASGQDVTLTLARVVAKDQPVSVTYTDPSAGDDSAAIQDEAGNDAETFTQPVTNNSEAISAGPDFGAETATREVAENSPAGTDVGDPVDATATDPLTYSLAGTDAAAFAIVSTSGQIQTTAGVTYDHEAAKNAYAVTVTADDGTDGTDATATVAVTITVTDVRERPSPPARPTVRGTAGEDTVTLEVSWREPENTGPPINDYDVRAAPKERAAEAQWFTWNHSGPGTSTTITDFFDSPTDPSVWVVQVRAFNAELTSEWSESGSTTDPSPPDLEEPTPTPGGGGGGVTPPDDADARACRAARHAEQLERAGGQRRGDADLGRAGGPRRVGDYRLSDRGFGGWRRAVGRPRGRYQGRGQDLYPQPAAGRDPALPGLGDQCRREGAPSAVAHATTTRPLGPPRNLRATGGDGEATLTWAAPADDGGSAITHYEYRYAQGETSPAETEWIPVGLDLRVTVTGLKNRQRYRFEVRAVNDSGEGEPAAVHVTVGQLDRVAQAWLSRFGRTVATHVTDAVGERLRASPGQGSHLTVGGYRLPLRPRGPARDEAEAPPVAALVTGLAGVLGLGPGGAGGPGDAGIDPGAPRPGMDPRLGQSRTLTLTLRQILQGSSFRLSLGRDEEGAAHPRLTAWGRVAATQYDGRDGTLAVDGDVLTGLIGVDGVWDRLLAGVAVSHSRGDGAYTLSGSAARRQGDLEQTLTSLHPYLRYAVTERLAVWGLLGYGWGELTLAPGVGSALTTDTALLMGAFGGRGILLAAAESGGFELATRTDAMLTRTTADAVAGMDVADAAAHRVRVILEGSRGFTWAEGRRLTPTVQLGLRHDWGDAETGFGLEVGGRVQYADPGLGLTVEGAVRALLAHEDADYEEWGAWGTVRVDPGPLGQGLSLTLSPTWGAAQSGVEGLWSRQTTAGLAPQGTGGNRRAG